MTSLRDYHARSSLRRRNKYQAPSPLVFVHYVNEASRYAEMYLLNG